MAGALPNYIKCYTREAVIVNPEDWNYLACSVIPSMQNDIYINTTDTEYINAQLNDGFTGSFLDGNANTVTVVNGIITGVA